MGSIGNTVSETFTYVRSPELKDWTDKEEQRTREMSRFVIDKTFEGSYQEFYEENTVEDLETITIPGDANFKEQEITLSKMNLVYAQNWDENDMRVKQGKAVTGSTYYLVQTGDGSIDETNFAYKTKADAEHAMKLYIDREKQYRAWWAKRK